MRDHKRQGSWAILVKDFHSRQKSIHRSWCKISLGIDFKFRASCDTQCLSLSTSMLSPHNIRVVSPRDSWESWAKALGSWVVVLWGYRSLSRETETRDVWRREDDGWLSSWERERYKLVLSASKFAHLSKHSSARDASYCNPPPSNSFAWTRHRLLRKSTKMARIERGWIMLWYNDTWL